MVPLQLTSPLENAKSYRWLQEVTAARPCRLPTMCTMDSLAGSSSVMVAEIGESSAADCDPQLSFPLEQNCICMRDLADIPQTGVLFRRTCGMRAR
jgi:hypothetical protein